MCCIWQLCVSLHMHFVLEEIGDVLHGLGEDRGWTSKPDLLGGDRGWTPLASLMCMLIDNRNISIRC